jgi:hypothetical protein
MASTLELAILAMDAYNRTGSGLDLDGSQIGRLKIGRRPLTNNGNLAAPTPAFSSGAELFPT